MKRIYLVRHGQSEGNVNREGQTPDSPLTEKGMKQAQFMARRAAQLPIERVVASTYKRAMQTADVIGAQLEKPVEYSPLFIEKKRPSEQVGRGWQDENFLAIDTAVWENFGVPGWHYSDEESFEELKERCRKALDFLAAEQEDHILVVTHGLFLSALVAYATFGAELTGPICKQVMKKFHVENTGITVLGYGTELRTARNESDNPWWVWVWNDHAHLAELG